MTTKAKTLEIEGRPVPKGRPRTTKTHTYTPKKTKRAENRILGAYQQKYGREEIDGPIEIVYGFYYSDRKWADIDNLEKLVSDALGGGSSSDWRPFDDKQIVKSHSYKILVDNEDEEKTIIWFREV